MSDMPSAAPAAAPSSSPAPSSAPSASSPSAPKAPTTSSTPRTSGSSSTTSSAPTSSRPADIAARAVSGEPAADGAPQPAAPDATPAEKAAAAEELRKWKIKVNGQERELTEAELLRRASLGYAADEKFQKAAETQRQVEQFVAALKSDPLSVLTDPNLGLDFRAVAEQFLSKELQRELLTPEQRELEELREWRTKQEEAAQRAQQEQMTRAQQQEFQQLQQRAAKEYDTKITSVLQQSNLPKTPYTVKRVAELLRGALQKGYDLDVETAVDMVRDGYMTDIQALVGGLEPEHLIKALGEDVTKKIRQHDLARIKAKLEAAQPKPAEDTPPPPAAKRDEQPSYLRPDEWKEMLRRKAGL